MKVSGFVDKNIVIFKYIFATISILRMTMGIKMRFQRIIHICTLK